jgi:ribonucleotide reductase beta subunit family protein with ferritin-like domain
MAVQEPPPEVEQRANDQLEQRASPYHALYEHWERNQWNSLALDFETDARSFRGLSETERAGLIWIFAHRFHAEFNVARLLAPFLTAAPSWEVELLLATQTADEHRHLQTVLRIYDEVFGVAGGIDAVRELADRNMDVVAETLYGRLEAHVTELARNPHPDLFLKAIVVYHLLGEGVIARTAQNLAAPIYEQFGDFPGLARGQRLVARDEARHIGIGISYCREQMQRDPQRTQQLVQEVIEEFSTVALELLSAANDGMAALVRTGYGVEPDVFYSEAQRLLGLRLRAIGFLDEEARSFATG